MPQRRVTVERLGAFSDSVSAVMIPIMGTRANDVDNMAAQDKVSAQRLTDSKTGDEHPSWKLEEAASEQ
jgi:hypothetical protein